MFGAICVCVAEGFAGKLSLLNISSSKFVVLSGSVAEDSSLVG
jgi:hypothetical protein